MDALHSPILPTKEEIATLPRFQNISFEKIIVIQNLQQAEVIREELEQVQVFGFDSESKPIFKAGEQSTGPHLIQLATRERAYLFQMNTELWHFLQPIFANPNQIKAGFGLKNDKQLFRKKDVELNGVLELSKCFGSFGLKQAVGVRNATALLFQVNFPKSKRISTSNWAARKLSQAQIEYAAADAYACILILEELWQRKLLSRELKLS
ncbi:3'-5' exonuclease [Acinetobacter schindleri]|uniref:3'-5' exonuclease n=1 Tax=Acinetobacter schindleri TaxID=108981 RepID=UPI00097275FE|nr:3'-5' exonuclease [Acinetobacter schindleri]APX61656.1 3'-5' exonuclease domain-containing protein [Acinetobacter schindleri]